jgi:hypothetical protein
MVWLYRLPIPVGEEGAFSSFKLFVPALAAFLGREEGGGQHPVGAACSNYSKKSGLLYYYSSTNNAYIGNPGTNLNIFFL